jgi:hypothetical protein
VAYSRYLKAEKCKQNFSCKITGKRYLEKPRHGWKETIKIYLNINIIKIFVYCIIIVQIAKKVGN